MNAKWFSERYGEDVLAIPNYEVEEGEIFYIGVFCEYKCNFEIYAMLQEEIEIYEGIMYQNIIEKKGTRLFKFKSKEKFQELDIVAFSPHLGPFKILVNKNNRPSNENSMLALPSWAGGYTVNIQKDTVDYCPNCYYFILIDAYYMDVQIYFFVRYEDTETTIISAEPIFASLTPSQKHCYKINIEENNKNENLIIQTTLFSGSLNLYVKPWSRPDEYSSRYYIQSEKILKFSPEERKINGRETGDFYFCFDSLDYTSYISRVYFESDIDFTQKLNYIYSEVELMGYLPKGKVTKYRIIEFLSKANITISLNTKLGNPKLYGYICENIRQCTFTRMKLEEELANNKIIKSDIYSLGLQKTEIKSEINSCHQKLLNDDTLENEMNSIPCATLAVVYCEDSQDCEYTIKAHLNNIVGEKLIPRKPIYQIIPYNQTNNYLINIEDEKITKITIILNSITGDADLSVTLKSKKGNEKENTLISNNAPYLPDVIQITKDVIGRDNLIGIYEVSVYGSSFASYSIVYYTEKPSNLSHIPDASISVMELQTGHIIKDLFEENTTKYKVYTYPQKSSGPLDIRITLTPERSQYAIYVFLDLTTLVYREGDSDLFKVQNAKWQSLYNNELIIKKTDTDYKKDAVYYIVIEKQYEISLNNNTNNPPHIPCYWLGVTNEFSPFLLYEGIPHSSFLDERLDSQTYWYTHNNVEYPFLLSINLFYGRVDVYADFQEIKDYNSDKFPLKVLDIDTEYLSISPKQLKEGCVQINNCGIFISIKKSSTYDVQYLIVAKSHLSKPEILNSGIVKTDSILAGESKNYYINFGNTKKNAVVFVSFSSGYGEVYINVPKEFQPFKKADYPTNDNYMYKAQDFYLGKVFNFNKDKFNFCDPCVILVSVLGRNLGFADDDIEYSIAYYDESRKINQNQPLKGFILQGEIQYFNVYFGKKAENVYISLTNQNGDVDLYMNYGNDYPTFQNSTWFSSTPYNEFIEFNKDDNYFITNKISDISGNYTIMLYGYSNSTYTLYLTSHPKKIIPVNLGTPASCKENSGGYCYFRFDEFEDFEKGLVDYDFIITTDYILGSGIIYASLFEKTDYDIIDNFPSGKKADYSSISKNSRNLLKFKIENRNTKLTKDSMLLITVECKENCFLDLNLVKMFDSDIQYLDLYRENIYYLYKKPGSKRTILVYYNWSNKDINYNVYTYLGSGRFKVYTNDTFYNSYSMNTEYNVTSINTFSTDYVNKATYHNFINNTLYETSYKAIYFSVEPIEDFGFYLKLSYDSEWNKVKVGQTDTYVVTNEEKMFLGYFDMIEDYEYAVLTVTSQNPNIFFYIYINYLVIDKNTQSNTNNYPIPDNTNSQLKGNTDSVFSSVSIKIQKNVREQAEKKFDRILLTVQAINLSFDKNIPNIQFDLTISPSVKGLSQNTVIQNKYIFTEFTEINKETKIYDLQKKIQTHDKMVILISPCEGNVGFKISDKLNFNKDDITTIENSGDRSGGKIEIQIDLKKYDSDNFYLTMWSTEGGNKDCYMTNERYICAEKTSVMFYYYTTYDYLFVNSFANKKGKIEIEATNSDSATIRWSTLLSKDRNDQINLIPANYTVYITENLFEYRNMGSVCYLSKMKINNDYTISIRESKDFVLAEIGGLKVEGKYFVNVLAKISGTNEVIAYDSIEIIVQPGKIPKFFMSILYIINFLTSVIIAILVIILLLLVFYFYKKFTVTQAILKYETSDVRNLSNIPRTQAELKDLTRASDKKKYVNLAAQSESIV